MKVVETKTKLRAALERPLRCSETGLHFMPGRQLGCQQGAKHNHGAPVEVFISSHAVYDVSKNSHRLSCCSLQLICLLAFFAKTDSMLKLQEPTRSRFSWSPTLCGLDGRWFLVWSN